MNAFQRRGTVAVVTTTSLALALIASASSASALTSAPSRTGESVAAAASKVPVVPVSGTWKNPTTGAVGTIAGTFTPQRFAVQNGQLVAIGALAAAITDSAGATVRTVSSTVTLPVQTRTSSASAQTSSAGASNAAFVPAAAQARCNVLNLVLGPLNLNLLGLVITLNQVNLNIFAVPGAGALLGNLLCAVAGLLDGGGLLTQISQLLNQILGILNGLGGLGGAAAAAPVSSVVDRTTRIPADLIV